MHNSEYFDIIQPYIEGEFYPGITTTYNSGTSIYDSKTHQYLGQYLRQVRDLHGIDLMPYYNCWDGTYIPNIRIESKEDGTQEIKKYIKRSVSNYNVIAVPVKFNEKYTVYINSNTPLSYAFAYYDGINISDSIYFPYDQKFGKIEYISTSSPALISSIKAKGIGIEAPLNVNTIYQEDYLVMLIQLPRNLDSPILVIEGDTRHQKILSYSEENDNHLVYNIGLTELFHGNVNIFKNYSPSSLTRTIGNLSYAFNSRLIEYLLWNIISPQDSIPFNTKRIQQYITTRKCKSVNGFNYEENVDGTKSNYKDLISGVWTDDLREFIYKLVTTTKKDKVLVDIDGYVDKDSEQIILRGKE